jgi:putative CocE/NonD family hydrolase
MQNQSQPIIDVDVPAPMRDGLLLRANIYRPAATGRWPVLLTRTAFGKDSADFPIQAARRGYVVIVQDTRGTNASDGDWYPFRPEADDGVDTIAWAAALPFSDGQVGMYGGSYDGFTQWAAAVHQPPALRAMAPFVTWADPLDGAHYRGGAFELGLLAYWCMGMGIAVLARRYGHDVAALDQARAALAAEIDALDWALPLANFAPLRRQAVAPAFFDSIAAPMDRTHEPAASATIVHGHDCVRIPSLNLGGWYDLFLGGTLANFAAMQARGVPTRLLIGPWSHGNDDTSLGERNFGVAAKADLDALQFHWFDCWLKGQETGLLAEAPIRLFVMGANIWRDEQEWPLARAVETPWYLHAGGVLSPERPGDEAPDRYAYDPADPVPTRGGAVVLAAEYPAGPFDQRSIEDRPDVLVYTSAPLERDIEVSGPLTVHLWAVSSAPDTDFVARLTDVFPDGRSFNLSDGIVRARYREFATGAAPSLIETGRPYAYVIDLWATSNVFQAGHRIRVQITSSCFPRWDRNPNTGHPFGADAEVQVAHQQILHDREHPSHIVLPVVAATAAG